MEKNKLNFCHVTALKGIAQLQIFQSSIKMRYLKFLLIVLFSFCLSNIYSQDFHTETIKFNPKENGHILNIPFSWKFIWFSGDVKIAINRHKKNEITTNTYIYEGKRYTSADIGTEPFTHYDIGLTSIRADVYHNAYFLGNIYMYHVADISAGGAGGQTYDLSQHLGINDEEYKDKINELSLRNLKIEDFSGKNIYLEAKIKKLEKDKNLNNVLSEADKILLSGDLKNAQNKYEEALRIDYTNNHAKNKLQEIKEKLNTDLTNQNDNASDWSDYESSSDNNSDETGYSKSDNSSSDNTNNNSNSYNNTQQIQKQQQTQKTLQEIYRVEKQTQSNIQNIQQTADNLSNLAGNIFAAQNAQRENEMARQAELERERREEERREREIEMAWNTMSDFEQKFAGNFKKNFFEVTSRECVYFYFCRITKDRNNKTGTLKLSNVFPIYCYSDGTWPYTSDITNKIKSIQGDALIRGYFLSRTEAQKDMNDAVTAARKSYFKYISLNAYNFTFNESSGSGNNSKDFWGNENNTNEKTPDVKDNKEKDFWGNISDTKKAKIDTLKIKADTLKKKTNDDFWK